MRSDVPPAARPGDGHAVYDIALRMRIAALWGESALRSPPHPSIALASSHDAIEAIGRLRYKLCIERDRKHDRHMDHARRLFIEPIDDLSLQIYAHVEGRLVAAIRLSRGQDAIFDPQLAGMLHAFTPATPPFADCLTVSRLVARVQPNARAQLAELIRFAYAMGAATGIARFMVFGVPPADIDLLEQLGCVSTGAILAGPAAEDMAIRAIRMHDRGDRGQVERATRYVGPAAADDDMSSLAGEGKAGRIGAGACHLTAARHLPS